jgi:PncC family amidohydrolase
VERIGEKLKECGQKLFIIETAAGGLISASLVSCPGASEWYEGGVIPYSNIAKTKFTGVTAGDLEMHGAVNKDIAGLMAFWSREDMPHCVTFAETSLSYKRPGARSVKEPGLSYMAVASAYNKLVTKSFQFSGDRYAIMQEITEQALLFIAEEIGAVEKGNK